MKGYEETPGIITMKGRDSGFENIQTWYFMVNTPDTAMVYYCGDLMTWHFEGVLVMSKTPEFNEMRKGEIAVALAEIGLSYSDLCDLDPETGCVDAPQ